MRVNKKHGPNTLETRAAKSASHRAPPGALAWDAYFALALLKLEAEAFVSHMVTADELRDDLFAPGRIRKRSDGQGFIFRMLPSQRIHEGGRPGFVCRPTCPECWRAGRSG